MTLEIKSATLTAEMLTGKENFLIPISAFSSARNSVGIASFISKHISKNCSTIQVELFDLGKKVAEGFVFQIDSKVGKVLVSGGRFGYCGLYVEDKAVAISPLLELVERHFFDQGCVAISLAIHGAADSVLPSSKWEETRAIYFVANLSDSCASGSLVFENAVKRSNLSRSIRKAEQNGLRVRRSDKRADIEAWYETCHLTRMNEIGGIPWPIEFFWSLLSTSHATLLKAESVDGLLLGGCFAIESPRTMELIMMSSPESSLKLGANYLLAKHAYLSSHRAGRHYVNWQGSNPPDGSVARFKESWNARQWTFPIYSRQFSSQLPTALQVSREFADTYVYPYDKLD